MEACNKMAILYRMLHFKEMQIHKSIQTKNQNVCIFGKESKNECATQLDFVYQINAAAIIIIKSNKKIYIHYNTFIWTRIK